MSSDTLQPFDALLSPRVTPSHARSGGAVSDGIPASPPPEVLDAVGTAAAAYDRLRSGGRQLHFATDPVTGRLSIEVHDLDGNLLTTLPPSRVLDLAAGGSLD